MPCASIDQYIVDNTSFGDKSFDTDIKAGEYAASIVASLLFILVFIIGSFLAAFLLAPFSGMKVSRICIRCFAAYVGFRCLRLLKRESVIICLATRRLKMLLDLNLM